MFTHFTRPARRIALAYVLVASLWIVFSDHWVASLFGDTEFVHTAQTLKGWFFVIATGLMLYGLMLRTLRRIQVVALEDALTGLPNRLAFTSELDTRCRQGLSRRHAFGLIIVDIDSFSDINDDEGHGRGDEFLGLLSQALTDVLTPGWYIGRLGGDEFGLISPANLTTEQVVDKIESLQQELSVRTQKSLFANQTLSAGLCWFPSQGVSGKELMSCADMALLHAKHCGRGLYRIYKEQFRLLLVKRLSLLKDLNEACQQKAFTLVYQPQWSALENCWIGVEVLIRWQHPKRGFVPPDEFIPLAEKEGLIGAITEFVVEQSLLELSEAGLGKEQLSYLSINLSHLALLDEHTMNNLFAIIEKSCIDCPKIVWEITETAAMENLDATLSIMQSSRYQNMDFSIDDFGTGYSSLSRLKQLPLSELKIDRSFIEDIPEDMNDAVIVKTILAMAKTLSLNVVAEGVETKQQAKFLKDNGCTILQGYLYARPIAISGLKQQLQEVPYDE